MNIDDEFYNDLIAYYEDDLDEKEVENKLKKMTASDIVDIKNSFDNEDFQRVDKLMGVVQKERRVSEEIERIMGLASDDYQPLYEYQIKPEEIKQIDNIAKKRGLKKKDIETFKDLWNENTNIQWSRLDRLMKNMGFKVDNTKSGVIYTSPQTGNARNNHGTRHKGKDSRIDPAFLNDVKELFIEEGIMKRVAGVDYQEELNKTDKSKEEWPKIRVYSTQEEAERKSQQYEKEWAAKTKGEQLANTPVGETKDGKLVYAYFRGYGNVDFNKAHRKAEEEGLQLQEDHTLSELKSITNLAGIPSLSETASAGGTSAGAVASGPVAPNEPYSPKSKKKKKKGKKKNPYGIDTLIRRWQ